MSETAVATADNNGAATVRVLMVGDVVGRPGRQAVARILPEWKTNGRADFIIVNAENAAHGKGLTKASCRELLDAGADVLTMGNHTWDNKDIFTFIADEPRLIRPLNFGPPPAMPGRGWGVFDVPARPGIRIAVLNLQGLVHLPPLPASPFLAADEALAQIHEETPIVFVDFHAEVTSEKVAMGWHLDGRATCVVGTHTHVATADARVLPGGTAYQTDLGMTGGHDGVIGVKKDSVLQKFLLPLPVRHEVAENDVWLNGLLVEVDTAGGRALGVERIAIPLPDTN